jgi:hypothetical protein
MAEPQKVKVFNRGKRTITCHDGHLLPNQTKPYLISKKEADKLTKLFPGEIVGTEEAMEPFKADAATPEPDNTPKAPQSPAPLTSADLPPRPQNQTQIVDAQKTAPVQETKPPATEEETAALTAAREARVVELLGKATLNDDEKKELDDLGNAGAGK